MCWASFSPKSAKALRVEIARGCASEIIAQYGMVSKKFFYERLQVSEVRGCRKQNLLFRRKMNCNLTLKLLLDLSLPRFKIDFACANSTIKPDAERQGMLVLARNRDQVFIAQHTRNHKRDVANYTRAPHERGRSAPTLTYSCR